MNNVSHIKNCYGCGVCAVICPRKVISIDFNKDGFYEPTVDDLKCIDCHLCLDVCAYQVDEILEPTDVKIVDSYAAWANNEDIRRKCSSGGIGFEIGKQLIEKGYKACGVKYNAEESRAEHYLATTVNEFIPAIGSKYIQSYTVDAFSQFSRSGKYLVVGTPCQIDSLRRYVRKKKIESNFILMDFFCHGVPSMLLWEKYLREVERITGKVEYVSWRNKRTGWHDSWAIGIDGKKFGEKVDWHDSYHVLIKEKKNYYNSRMSEGNLFYKGFLSDTCLGKACYDRCKYKLEKSAADIRIGDLWGSMFRENEEGVSGVVVFSELGGKVVKEIKKCTFQSLPLEIVMEGQMKQSPSKPILYSFIIGKLRSKAPVESIMKWIYIAFLLKRINRKIKLWIGK